MKIKYPVAEPDLTGNELRYTVQALREGVISSRSPFVERFEKAFAEFTGSKYAVAVNTGTSALQLSLMALGIGPGDEVIVPEFTMVASAWAVSYTGATPVFVDCGEDFNIDVSKITEKITPRTKAIMPVHIYGRPVDMLSVMAIAAAHGLAVVEDACEAHGARILGGLKVGAIGNVGCFSLFGNKIITAGEGGVCVTDDPMLAEKMRYLRSMAFEGTHTFLHKETGNNFRMTGLQAAVALAQVERIDGFLAKRKQICEWYDQEIGDMTVKRPGGSVLWVYDILTEKRDEMIDHLAAHGIESRMFFKPMSMQPMYDRPYANLNALAYANSGCYLPAYTRLRREDVSYICEVVKNFVSKSKHWH